MKLFIGLWVAAGVGTMLGLLQLMTVDEKVSYIDMIVVIIISPLLIILWPVILSDIINMFKGEV